MSRLRPIDRWLVAVLVPIWVLAFGASLRDPQRSIALTPAYVTLEAADAHPVVSGTPPWVRDHQPAAPLEPGDRILRIGGEDAAGAGVLSVLGRSWEARGGDGSVVMRIARDGDERDVSVPLGDGVAKWYVLPASAAFALAAIIGIFRLPRSRFVQVSFPAAMAFALFLASYFGSSREMFVAAVVLRFFALTFVGPLFIRSAAHFPDSVKPPAWIAGWPWIFAVQGIVNLSVEIDAPLPWTTAIQIAPIAALASVVAIVVVFTRNYLVADPMARRPMRWVAWGTWIGNTPLVVMGVLASFGALPGNIYLPSHIGLVVIPAAFAIGIERDDLFDVDRVLTATAAVMVLAVCLVAGGLWVVPQASHVVAAWAGLELGAAQVIVSLATAAVVVPLGWQVRGWLDRSLHDEARRRERRASALLRQLAECREPREIHLTMGRGATDLLGAESGMVVAHAGAEFAPVFAQKVETAPVLDAGGELVAALAAEGGVCGVESLADAGLAEARTLLGATPLELLVPLKRGDTIEAILALGPRSTGEPYTPADRVLIAAVAEKASAELARFEQATLLAQGREMVEALRAEKDEAVRANRAKSTLLASASHDLRQPLHALGLFAGALEDRVDDPESRALVERLQASARAMEQMFDAVLDLSKLDAGVLEPMVVSVPLGPLLARLAAEQGAQAELRGIELRAVATSCSVRSDPVLLGRIVQNLVSNAIRYTDQGRVLLGCRRAGDSVRIEVWDTGRGIAEAERRAIFQEYRRVPAEAGQRDVKEGLGLGLSIVRRLADLLGHPMGLRSELGKGSVFHVTVPRVAGVAAAAPTATAAPAFDARVLVVDDDPAVRDAMRRLLEPWGCKVATAGSVDEAVAGARDEPDVLLVDYGLGGGETGLDALAAVRDALGAHVPGLVLTGETGEEVLAEIRASGTLLLAKPAAPVQLRAALRHLLAGRT